MVAAKRTRKSKPKPETPPASAPASPGELPIERIALAKINPAPYNPSNPIAPGSASWSKLRKSIETFGLAPQLVWNRQTGNLIGGHQTLAVMREIWPEATDARVYVADLPPELERAFNVRLNQRSTDNDPVRFGQLLQELIDAELDTALTGLDEEHINSAIAEMEAACREAEQEQKTRGEGETETAGGNDAAPADELPAATFQVLATCRSEGHQREVYELLRKAKIECRILTVN